ncbi:MAG: hypothetical protein JKY80_01870 [Mariprofundaceae bacterium]|nr:hypothetical protein [Mariprofundaceae bacterium]
MSKLVIHVGYPKTATSTIQNKFFYPLHQKGEINFLGKACLGDVNYNPSSDLVMSTVYNKGKFKEFYLSKNIWNVVSNEDFVVSFFNIDNRKFLPESSSLKTPYNLKAALDSMEHSPDVSTRSGFAWLIASTKSNVY